jgi:hypothetical protein
MADSERPFRLCESCGKVDQAPRHVFGQADGDAPTPDDIAIKALQNAQDLGPEQLLGVVQQIRDDSVVYKHMDCCAADGCPDGTCDGIVAEAEGRKDDDLVAFITGQEG